MITRSDIVPLRRPDIMARPEGEAGRYRIEDPLGGRVFQAGPEEHFLLGQCDGRREITGVCRAFAERFGRPLSTAEFADFVDLVRSESLIAEDQALWKSVEDTWWNMSPEGAVFGREAAVEATRDERLKKYRRFFWEYDRHSHPMLTDHNPDIPDEEKTRRKQHVCDAFAILSVRVLMRGDLHRAGRQPALGELPVPDDDRSVSYLSTFQLDLIRRCLPGGEHGIDLAAFSEAFEMFGNGELRVEERSMPGPSESNNGNNFSFAEFGFLAVEQGVDVEIWSQLLNPLVRMQRIFMRVYQPDGPGPYSFCDYRPANFAPEKQVDAAFKRRLRDEFAGLNVEQLADRAGRNAHEAFTAGWRSDLRSESLKSRAAHAFLAAR